MVQWLRLFASNAGGTGLIPDQGTKIPHGLWPKNKLKYQHKKCHRTNSSSVNHYQADRL